MSYFDSVVNYKTEAPKQTVSYDMPPPVQVNNSQPMSIG